MDQLKITKDHLHEKIAIIKAIGIDNLSYSGLLSVY